MTVLESAHHEDSETPPTYVIRIRRQGSISKEKVQGVSVKVGFSPSMSQGLNLIKYW